MSRPGARTVTAAALAVLLAMGCADDEPVASAPDAGEEAEAAADAEATGNVTASLVAGPRQDGQQAITLRLEGEQGPPGAYQGRLHFPAGLELTAVEKPDEGFHVVNRAGAEQGRLRFAGFAVPALPAPSVLTFRFAGEGELSDDDLRLQLEAVGTREGLSVPDEDIRILPGLRSPDDRALRPEG